MALALYNSLTRTVSPFIPVRPPLVTMYVCGITPYDACHLGHARSYVVFDTLRRYLTYRGFHVRYVQNVTDVDDKIVQRAQATQQAVDVLVQRYTDDYFRQMDRLGVQRAESYPRATRHIADPERHPNIIEMIQGLEGKGAAYRVASLAGAGQDVYFAVRRCPGYGRLSNQRVEELRAGARIEIDPRKQDPLDFALWKVTPPHEPGWDSPWGRGRPGWHIECSAMSLAYLGSPIDIHGGGQDLLFPHHENEIAQSESFTGAPFVRCWVHNGFVTLRQEKMSKSLGNVFLLGDLLQRVWPEVLRLFFVSHHYRAPLDFAPDLLDQAKRELLTILHALVNAMDLFPRQDPSLAVAAHGEAVPPAVPQEIEGIEADFQTAMDDDLNTSLALAQIHRTVRWLNRAVRERVAPTEILSAVRVLYRLADVLGVRLELARLRPQGLAPLEGLLAEREAARQHKDWTAADAIRQEIAAQGFVIEDTPQGPRLKKGIKEGGEPRHGGGIP